MGLEKTGVQRAKKDCGRAAVQFRMKLTAVLGARTPIRSCPSRLVQRQNNDWPDACEMSVLHCAFVQMGRSIGDIKARYELSKRQPSGTHRVAVGDKRARVEGAKPRAG